MGHDVSYIGSLKLKNPITQEQKNFLAACQDDDSGLNRRLYCLKLNEEKNCFEFNKECEKCYYDSFYPSIINFITELKKLGNDIIDKSYMISCSEYGLDYEAVILVYNNGNFIQKQLLELASEYVAEL